MHAYIYPYMYVTITYCDNNLLNRIDRKIEAQSYLGRHTIKMHIIYNNDNIFTSTQ